MVTSAFAQDVDLRNNVDFVRIQKSGETDFSNSYGLSSTNNLFIGSLTKTIKDIHFFNFGNGNGYLMTLKPNGNVGIGTTNPEGNLQIGESTANGMLFLGGGKGYSGIGSTRSDGGLVLGWNVYARYDDATDNWKARVGKSNGYQGYSGIKITQQGVIDFFGHRGAVTADEIANTDERIKMRIDKYGNVGIGTIIPDSGFKLSVKGKVSAREIKVTATAGGADFVFAEDYNLPKLEAVEAFIKEHKYLPEIPSAKEMNENGIHLAAMNIKLLQKVEELTLYTIQQEKDIKNLQTVNTENEELKERVTKLEALVEKIVKQ